MEFLKEVLGDELFSQVSEKLSGNENIKLANLADGKYVPLEKFNAERASSKSYKTQIEELNGKLAQMQNEASASDVLKAQIAQLTQSIAAKDAEMKAERLTHAVLDAARKNKAKDPDIVAKMIDRTKISETESGYAGMDEQFDELVKTYGYMFDGETPKVGGFAPNQIPVPEAQNENSMMNDLIRKVSNFR